MKDLNKKLDLQGAQEFANAINEQIAEDKAMAAIGNNNSLLGTDKKKGAQAPNFKLV